MEQNQSRQSLSPALPHTMSVFRQPSICHASQASFCLISQSPWIRWSGWPHSASFAEQQHHHQQEQQEQ
eukprot:8863132-Pyramimonas_sp.AAC.1